MFPVPDQAAARALPSNRAPTTERRTAGGAGDGAFQECSGLEVEMDVQDYQEGGRTTR
jgi:hypothetical protein